MPGSTPLYHRLRATAETFAHAFDTDACTGSMDKARIMAVRTTTCTQSWGHAFYVSSRPGLQGSIDNDAFWSHLSGMANKLETVGSKVHDVIVDESRRAAMVRMSFFITARGAEETVENDMVWFLEMDETGDRIEKSVEYMDGEASKRLGELIKKGEPGGFAVD